MSSHHPQPPRGACWDECGCPRPGPAKPLGLGTGAHIQSTGPSRSKPSVPSGTQCTCVYLPGEQNKLFPLLWGGPCRVRRGQREVQSRLGTSSQCQALRARSAGPRNVGPCATPLTSLLLASGRARPSSLCFELRDSQVHSLSFWVEKTNMISKENLGDGLDDANF